MNENGKFALAVVVVGTLLMALAGCEAVAGGTDMTPVGNGLSFIGLGLVLASLILTFGLSRNPGRKDQDEDR